MSESVLVPSFCLTFRHFFVVVAVQIFLDPTKTHQICSFIQSCPADPKVRQLGTTQNLVEMYGTNFEMHDALSPLYIRGMDFMLSSAPISITSKFFLSFMLMLAKNPFRTIHKHPFALSVQKIIRNKQKMWKLWMSVLRYSMKSFTTPWNPSPCFRASC